ncbi:Abscission/NoCut checkpoint regulator [Madurella mycetomatis]|uniref:Abscission/NoCut checkpoint regulator n=1 Tax=Madurella mycetomatis TaxID=100816 RepID=A0A175W9I6_9PEZI|nr:Abscission/NoCut checkpoint regulator [Madurella mycetomatis]
MAPSDQSLLDRLNALKPTSITISKPEDAAAIPALEQHQPASREDALTARLRTLRNQTCNNDSVGTVPDLSAGGKSDGGCQTPQPPTKPKPPALVSRASERKVAAEALSPPGTAGPGAAQKRGQYRFLEAEANADDEDALDELLESLGDEDFDLAADGDVDSLPDCGPSGDGNKLADLVESLQEDSAPDKSAVPHEDDDDSDGEQMARAVETVLSQLQDEINSLPSPSAAGEENEKPPPGEASSVPSTEGDVVDGHADDATLALPAVPTQLVDPVTDAKEDEQDRRKSIDFENDISARLASLRGLGNGTALDAFGLPSVPTFRPQDRPTSTNTKGLRSTKYTDEDQSTWCIACLDDATIRCVGCDNDVYCARCWREMHVGPSAGYDERGHQWVKFARDHRA